jgi:hypothetical protein
MTSTRPPRARNTTNPAAPPNAPPPVTRLSVGPARSADARAPRAAPALAPASVRTFNLFCTFDEYHLQEACGRDAPCPHPHARPPRSCARTSPARPQGGARPSSRRAAPPPRRTARRSAASPARVVPICPSAPSSRRGTSRRTRARPSASLCARVSAGWLVMGAERRTPGGDVRDKEAAVVRDGLRERGAHSARYQISNALASAEGERERGARARHSPAPMPPPPLAYSALCVAHAASRIVYHAARVRAAQVSPRGTPAPTRPKQTREELLAEYEEADRAIRRPPRRMQERVQDAILPLEAAPVLEKPAAVHVAPTEPIVAEVAPTQLAPPPRTDAHEPASAPTATSALLPDRDVEASAPTVRPSPSIPSATTHVFDSHLILPATLSSRSSPFSPPTRSSQTQTPPRRLPHAH